MRVRSTCVVWPGQSSVQLFDLQLPRSTSMTPLSAIHGSTVPQHLAFYPGPSPSQQSAPCHSHPSQSVAPVPCTVPIHAFPPAPSPAPAFEFGSGPRSATTHCSVAKTRRCATEARVTDATYTPSLHRACISSLCVVWHHLSSYQLPDDLQFSRSPSTIRLYLWP